MAPDDTQPLDLSEVFGDAPWANPVNREENRDPLGWDIDGDGELNSFESSVPEPALLRGALVTGGGIVGAALGFSLDVVWIDAAVALYALAAPFVLAVWIRRNVTPVRK